MNKTSAYDFTILVPIYNEVDNFVRIEKELATFLNDAPLSTCVLLVDDGSIDGSREEIFRVCTRNKDFFYLLLKENKGLSTALKAGIDFCQSEYLGYLDADLQTFPEDFKLLLPFRAEYPLVTGIRLTREDNLIKKLSSRIANSFRRFMTGDGVKDTGCPLKVIRTEYARRIPFFKGMHRFIPALILLQDGGSVKQVPVRHQPRMAGTSKYHLWNRLTGPFLDCFAYRWMKKRYINIRIDRENISDVQAHSMNP